jgi:hypothetical protein
MHAKMAMGVCARQPYRSSRNPARLDNGASMPVRVSCALLAGWLIVSALAWPHDGLQLLNAWLCGDLLLLFALLGSRTGTRIIGLWLVATSVFLESWHPATALHNALVGLILFSLPSLSD